MDQSIREKTMDLSSHTTKDYEGRLCSKVNRVCCAACWKRLWILWIKVSIPCELAIKFKGEELNSQGANIENSVSNDINSKRLQAKLCSNLNDSLINVSCDFRSSKLDKHNKKLREAFDLLLACGNLNTGKKEAFPEYLRLISNPFEYGDSKWRIIKFFP